MGCALGNQLSDIVYWIQLYSPYESIHEVAWAATAQATVGIKQIPRGTFLSVTRPAAVTFSGSLTMVLHGAHTFVVFPAKVPEYDIESIVADRDKWNLEIQNHRVYSASV